MAGYLRIRVVNSLFLCTFLLVRTLGTKIGRTLLEVSLNCYSSFARKVYYTDFCYLTIFIVFSSDSWLTVEVTPSLSLR